MEYEAHYKQTLLHICVIDRRKFFLTAFSVLFMLGAALGMPVYGLSARSK